jgi:hypothetical protein
MKAEVRVAPRPARNRVAEPCCGERGCAGGRHREQAIQSRHQDIDRQTFTCNRDANEARQLVDVLREHVLGPAGHHRNGAQAARREMRERGR